MKKLLPLLFLCYASQNIMAITPLGMFAPYDINIKLKKPAAHNIQINFLEEHSFNIKGYATNEKEDEIFTVDPLQIYEKQQNLISMYQGIDTTNAKLPQLLDSIASGAGGGVSNYQNGLFTPTGKLSCNQFAANVTYGLDHFVYLSAYLPFYSAALTVLAWNYTGNNTLFAGEAIQQEIIASFSQDAQKYFDLNINSWKQHGIGDLTLLAEWQRDFPQLRRTVLKSVQANLRIGISIPTAARTNEHIIMPIPFGADGVITIPFGGGLGIALGEIAEIGFSGQFWYLWNTEKLRRIKTFPTQTTLLFPTLTETYKESAIWQNFNLHAQLFTPCKRFSFKAVYQHWKKQKDTLIPIDANFNFEVVNSALSSEEASRHDIFFVIAYSPKQEDFSKVIPQLELFAKATFGGTRAAIASTLGAQLSLIF